MSAFVFDLLILAVLALCAWRGAKRGLVRALCSLLAMVVAFWGAGFCARTFAPQIAAALEPRLAIAIEERLTEEISKAAQSASIDPQTGKIDSALPEGLPFYDILNVIKASGIYDEFIEKFYIAAENGLTGVAASAAAAIATQVAEKIAYSLIFLISFSLISAAWSVVSRTLNLVSRLPGLRLLNKIGGAISGFAMGYVIVAVVAVVVVLLGGIVPTDMIEGSRLLGILLPFLPNALPGLATAGGLPPALG